MREKQQRRVCQVAAARPPHTPIEPEVDARRVRLVGDLDARAQVVVVEFSRRVWTPNAVAVARRSRRRAARPPSSCPGSARRRWRTGRPARARRGCRGCRPLARGRSARARPPSRRSGGAGEVRSGWHHVPPCRSLTTMPLRSYRARPARAARSASSVALAGPEHVGEIEHRSAAVPEQVGRLGERDRLARERLGLVAAALAARGSSPARRARSPASRVLGRRVASVARHSSPASSARPWAKTACASSAVVVASALPLAHGRERSTSARSAGSARSGRPRARLIHASRCATPEVSPPSALRISLASRKQALGGLERRRCMACSRASGLSVDAVASGLPRTSSRNASQRAIASATGVGSSAAAIARQPISSNSSRRRRPARAARPPRPRVSASPRTPACPRRPCRAGTASRYRPYVVASVERGEPGLGRRARAGS